MAILELDPQEAHAVLTENPAAVLVDVRSTMEFDYVGHPSGALHIALMEPPAWQTDPQFVAKVRQVLAENSPTAPEERVILTLCRSGKRSLAAANLLQEAGFRKIYNIREGFEGDLDPHKHRNSRNGWRARGLPWEQG